MEFYSPQPLYQRDARKGLLNYNLHFYVTENVMRYFAQDASATELIARARILNDLTMKEARDFTEGEEAEYDALMNRLDELGVKGDDPFMPAMARDLDTPIPEHGEYFRDLKSGKAIRAYRPDEQISGYSDLRAGRYLRGMVTGNWVGAEREHRTALNTGTDAEGAYLVPQAISNQVVDAARNKTCVIKAGARTMNMEAKQVTIARLDTDPTVAWMSENASMSEDSTTAFGAVVLTARTVRGYVPISLEAAQDAINIESVVSNALASALALAVDSAALTGSSGSTNPTGLLNTSGVGEVDPDTDGFAISSLDEFSDAIQDIEDANGNSNNLAAIYAPRTANQIRKVKDGQGSYLASPPFWTDMQKYVTNQVPVNVTHGASSNTSYAFVGDYSQMVIGVRDSLRLEVVRQATDAVKKHQIWLVVSGRYDVGVVRPAHFSIIKGIQA